MASVVQIQNPPNPMLTMEQIGVGMQNIRNQQAKRQLMQQQQQQMAQNMATAQQMAPLDTAKAQAQIDLLQAQTQNIPLALAEKQREANQMSVMAAIDPISGKIQYYNRKTGQFVDPGHLPVYPTGKIGGAQAGVSSVSVPPSPGLGAQPSPSGTAILGPETGDTKPDIFRATNLEVAPTSTRYSKIMQGIDPVTGLPTVFSSPAQSALSMAQQRAMGESGLAALRDWMLSTTDPYVGMLGYGTGKASTEVGRMYFMSPQEREKTIDRLANLYAYNLLKPELGSTLTRMGLGGPGAEDTRRQMREVLGKNIGNVLTPSPEIIRRGNRILYQKQQELANAEIKEAAKGFPLTNIGKKVPTTIKIPSFNSKADYENWFNNLSMADQEKVKGQLK